MKRLISFLLVLAMAGSSLSAISYEPSFCLSTGFRGSHINDEYLRTHATLELEIDALAIGIADGHRLSLPGFMTIVSTTTETEGTSLNGYIDFGMGLAYEKMLGRNIYAGLEVSGIYRYYHEIDSALMGLGAGLSFLISPDKWIGIEIPLTLRFFKGEIDYSISIGSKFTLR